MSLRALGLVLHLGHGGNPCPTPGDFKRNFTVMHSNGIHVVNISFCGCNNEIGASHSRIQLLRARLLPASIDAPRTAFSFDVLNSFHLITLQGKTSAYHYYLSIAHQTDNVGLSNQPVCAISTSPCALYLIKFRIVMINSSMLCASGVT